jgi:hypothetical protein
VKFLGSPVRLGATALIAALLVPALAACSGTAARPPTHGGPVPLAVAHHLPPGTFYFLAGPDATSLNVWQVSANGAEEELTHNKADYGISDFGASPAGIVLADAANGVDELARLTSHGSVLLPGGHVSEPRINATGQIVAVRPPDDPGYPHKFQLDIKASFRAVGKAIYQQRGSLLADQWGPDESLAVISCATPDGTGRTRLLIIDAHGDVRKIPTGLTHLGNLIWGERALLAVDSWNDTAEIIRPGKQPERLPTGWLPAAWSPAGTQLLVRSINHRLGIWSPRQPGHIRVLGTIPRHIQVPVIAWLSKPAPE